MGFVQHPGEGYPERGRADRAAPDDWPSEPETADEADPWSDDPPRQETRSRERSEPRGNSSRQSGGNRSSSSQRSSRGSSNMSGGNSRQVNQDWPDEGVEYDKFDRKWTFGEDDAPECDHEFIAALVEGENKNGKPYPA